jgi:sporulation protein YunB
VKGGFLLAKIRRRMTRRGPLPFRYVFLLTFVFFTFSTAIGLYIIDKGLEPILMSYADSQTRRIASMVINNAVKSNIANEKDINDIFEEVPLGNDGKNSIKLNAQMIRRIMAETEGLIQDNLSHAEKGNLEILQLPPNVEIKETDDKTEGFVYYIPLGQATNNALLGNLGPKIPVRFTPIGDVRTDIVPTVQERGINNTWIEVSIKIEVRVQMILPFATKITKMQQSIPVAMMFYPGEVPQYFNGGGHSAPSIELPTNNTKEKKD